MYHTRINIQEEFFSLSKQMDLQFTRLFEKISILFSGISG